MGAIQRELSKHKDASLQLHSLRAEVHSLSGILTRKVYFVLLVCTISGQVLRHSFANVPIFIFCFVGTRN
jgi:hypothetical protein